MTSEDGASSTAALAVLEMKNCEGRCHGRMMRRLAGGAVFIGAFSFAIDYYMESYSMEEVYKLSW